MNEIIAQKQYISNKLKIPYENLSQSYVRAETLLTTHTDIRFIIQEGKATIALLPTERLIQLNDQFVATHFRITAKAITTATPSDTQQLVAILYHHADAAVFTVNSANVAALFNSSFNWTIDRKEFIPTFPMNAFYRVPEQQTVADADYTASGIDYVPSSPNGLYGFYPCEPVILDGRQTNDAIINLEASVTFNDAARSIYAVFEVRGFLVVNAKN